MTWTLHHGDCLDPVSGLASLPDKSVDHVITDPPYEAEAHTKARRTKTRDWRRSREVGTAHLVAVTAPLPFEAITEDVRTRAAAEMARACRRWAVVFCQTEAAHLWAKALEAGGMSYVRTMVWIKPDGQPQFSGDRPGVGYESMVVAHHPASQYRWNGGGRLGVFSHSKNSGRVNGNGSGTPGWEPAPHPTTKPLPLMLELVSLFTDPGDTVLDPFAGSGSTGVACNQLGRSFIGWEMNAEYHAIATRRLNGDEAKPRPEQPGLFDARPA